MIFITVGTQAPFDRLIKVIDEWVSISGEECFAQISTGKYKPKHFNSKEYLTEQEFNEVFQKASVIISHAGMGTIISSLKEEKILLTLPRLLKYKEHRNDHQIATTEAFSEKGFIYPIFNEKDLEFHLNKLSELSCLKAIEDKANPDLLEFLENC